MYFENTWALIQAKVSRLSMRWWLSFSVGVDLDDLTTNVACFLRANEEQARN